VIPLSKTKIAAAKIAVGSYLFDNKNLNNSLYLPLILAAYPFDLPQLRAVDFASLERFPKLSAILFYRR
jgi:hypothetical protein